MTPILAASILTVVVLASWHFGRVVEWYLNSKRCWPITKRLAFMLLALEFLRPGVERLLRAML